MMRGGQEVVKAEAVGRIPECQCWVALTSSRELLFVNNFKMLFFQKLAMSADTDSDFSDTEIERVSSVTKISYDSVPKDIDFELKIKGSKKVRLEYVLKKGKILPYTADLQGKN